MAGCGSGRGQDLFLGGGQRAIGARRPRRVGAGENWTTMKDGDGGRAPRKLYGSSGKFFPSAATICHEEGKKWASVPCEAYEPFLLFLSTLGDC